jgi:glycosyltransferase involved in cell wall biosynthesis
VLFVGGSYYNAYYLSRKLRNLGWRANVMTYPGDMYEQFGHGQDIAIDFRRSPRSVARRTATVARAFLSHNILHFSGVHNLRALYFIAPGRFGKVRGGDIRFLKRLGKKIVYSQSGCLDGVSQTSFAKWGDQPVCLDCIWRTNAAVCSDQKNLAWGKLRNSLCDFQVSAGGNRVDFNDDPHIHEVPEFYCLDPDVWSPDQPVPEEHRLKISPETVKIYHAVGNFDMRTSVEGQRNIKSTHIYVPTIQRLKDNGYNVELVFIKDVPGRVVRYYQQQADIVVDMLTYGFYGANVREALMLGKPVVCYLRPEWLTSIRREVPEFVDQLPIISATPENVYEVLEDLVRDRGKRHEIGRRSREFAVRWHSSERAAKRFDEIYSDLLAGGNGVPGHTREYVNALKAS